VTPGVPIVKTQAAGFSPPRCSLAPANLQQPPDLVLHVLDLLLDLTHLHEDLLRTLTVAGPFRGEERRPEPAQFLLEPGQFVTQFGQLLACARVLTLIRSDAAGFPALCSIPGC